MDVHKLDQMKDGWFVGDFEPSVMRTHDFEVGLHCHAKGETCDPHFHVLTNEINVVVSGSLEVNGEVYGRGDILVLHPKEICEVTFLEDTELVVVKSPSVPGDKYDASLRAPAIERT